MPRSTVAVRVPGGGAWCRFRKWRFCQIGPQIFSVLCSRYDRLLCFATLEELKRLWHGFGVDPPFTDGEHPTSKLVIVWRSWGTEKGQREIFLVVCCIFLWPSLVCRILDPG